MVLHIDSVITKKTKLFNEPNKIMHFKKRKIGDNR